MTLTPHAMTDPAAIRTFVLAGDAKLTLKSQRTEKHYTYKVEQATDKETGEGIARWFVKVLTGPDNWANYTYAGCIVGRDENFVLTSGSRFTEAAESVKAWRYFWAGIQAGRVMPLLEVWHQGRCGRCGRPLTVPESISTGFGPDCADMLGIVWAVRPSEALIEENEPGDPVSALAADILAGRIDPNTLEDDHGTSATA